MKKLVLFSLTAFMLGFCSCGEQRSEALQALEKNIENLEVKIQEAEDCEDLEVLSISVLGLRTDLEKLQQDESVKEDDIIELTNSIDQIDASLTGKYAAMGCNQVKEDDGEFEVFGDGEYEDYNVL